ncbi:MAG: DUF2267 domain-containing protein [bacterium]
MQRLCQAARECVFIMLDIPSVSEKHPQEDKQMQYHEFIDRVQKLAGLESADKAVKATEATLETLGERLYRTERDELAAQLPKELKECLFRRQDTERFLLEDFYKRVSARADVHYHRAVELAQAVAAVLRGAVSQGELSDILAGLDAEYGELFGEKPKGPLSP